MSKNTPMKIEFSNTMFAGLFSEEWNAKQQVASLNRLSQSVAGNPDLPMWDYISIGYDREVSEFLIVIYSPRGLGRTLSKKEPKDVKEAYFCVLDNYIYDLDEPLNLKRLEDDFGEDHSDHVSQPLSEIFDSWCALNQKRTLEKNLKNQTHAPSAKRKL